MIECFSVLCFLYSKDSSVIQKLEDQKPPKIAQKFAKTEN